MAQVRPMREIPEDIPFPADNVVAWAYDFAEHAYEVVLRGGMHIHVYLDTPHPLEALAIGQRQRPQLAAAAMGMFPPAHMRATPTPTTPRT